MKTALVFVDQNTLVSTIELPEVSDTEEMTQVLDSVYSQLKISYLRALLKTRWNYAKETP